TFFSSKLIVDTTTQGLYVWSKAEYGKIMISSIAPVFRCAHRGSATRSFKFLYFKELIFPKN
ncbi:hypothetical protein FIV31_06105, partial [Coxiella endosymbiont of Ornithodoros amblus]|nr:hypothetical protein [Coxiella endosymbiont of Ornithodoros amblus]